MIHFQRKITWCLCSYSCSDDEMGKAEVALCDLKKEQENVFDLPLTDVESGILTVSLTPEFFGN